MAAFFNYCILALRTDMELAAFFRLDRHSDIAVCQVLIVKLQRIFHLHLDIILFLMDINIFSIDPKHQTAIRRVITSNILFILLKIHMNISQPF